MCKHLNTAVCESLLAHVSQVVSAGLSSSDKSRKCITHKEHWEVLFIFVCSVLDIGQGLNECSFICLVGYGVVGVTWKVNSVDLVKK